MTETISKQKAKENGYYFYYTGKPCKRGNYAYRRVSNGQCVCEDCKENMRVKRREIEKRPENIEKQKEKDRRLAKKYPEKQRQKLRKQYRNNRHKFIKKSRERETKLRQSTPIWYKNQTEKVKQIYDLCKELEKLTGESWTVDHIYPLMGKNVCGLHCYENLQPMPAFLNKSKNNSEEYTEYLSWLKDYEGHLYTPLF